MIAWLVPTATETLGVRNTVLDQRVSRLLRHLRGWRTSRRSASTALRADELASSENAHSTRLTPSRIPTLSTQARTGNRIPCPSLTHCCASSLQSTLTCVAPLPQVCVNAHSSALCMNLQNVSLGLSIFQSFNSQSHSQTLCLKSHLSSGALHPMSCLNSVCQWTRNPSTSQLVGSPHGIAPSKELVACSGGERAL